MLPFAWYPSTYPVVLAGRIVVGGIDSYLVVVFLILFLPAHVLRDLRFFVTDALENINVDSYNSQTQTNLNQCLLAPVTTFAVSRYQEIR